MAIFNKETKTQIMEDFERKSEIKNSIVLNPGNTVKIELNDGTIIIRLHHTNIVTKNPDGTIVLDSGGYKTMITKTRMNEHAPISLWQDKGMWYLTPFNVGYWDENRKEKTINFYDGMVIDENGNLLSENRTVDMKEIRKLKKRIKEFADQVLTMDELPMPNAGDCWICSMFEKTDCLQSHLDENYLHGSLIKNAFLHCGYRVEQMALFYQMGMRDRISKNIYKYMRDKLIVHGN